MAIHVDMYVSDEGEILFPLTASDNNISDLISDKGTFFKVFTTDTSVPQIEAGNPMGLLLVLTYPATP